MAQSWTWEPWVHPRVAGLLAEPVADSGWCARLDSAPTDPVVGKVLCVCAALGIAREVLTTDVGATPVAPEALELLELWIDDPTEERFDRICGIIFKGDRGADLDTHGIVWWALRTATSTAEGYGEAGWALSSLCGGALNAGFSADQLRRIAERAVAARMANPTA